nr:hypothetical protein [Candidatus Enterousia merdequi]
MNKTNKILLKIFCVALAFVCNFYNDATAVDPSIMATRPVTNIGSFGTNIYSNEDYDRTNMLTRTSNDGRCVSTGVKKKCTLFTQGDQSKNKTQTLCPAGSYLHQCGNYIIGANTLKPVQIPTKENPSTDYYQNCKDNGKNFAECLREFFDEQDDNFDAIIGWICSPETTFGKYTCLKCPNDGKVDASTVDISTTSEGGIIPGSFKIKTIAHCYQNKFEDDTGTYTYITDITDSSNDVNCFYTPDNIPEGTEIQEVSTFFETEIMTRIQQADYNIQNLLTSP